MTGNAINLDFAYYVLAFALLAIVACGVCAGLVTLLRPLLLRHVMAKPTRRRRRRAAASR